VGGVIFFACHCDYFRRYWLAKMMVMGLVIDLGSVLTRLSGAPGKVGPTPEQREVM
jgi:hypothetical protein